MSSRAGGSITRTDVPAPVCEPRGETVFSKTLVVTAMAILTFALALYALDPPMPIASHFFRNEDFPVLVVASLLLLALGARRPSLPLGLPQWALRRPMAAGVACAILLFAAAAAGAVFALDQFDLVRDELDANFDAAIFRTGRLLAPLAPEWRPYVAGFRGPAFVLPVPGDVAWASSYLPGNAALRALMAASVGAQWTNPLLLAIAIVAVFGVARRLWPERPDAALIAGLLLASSSQALVNAMTSYAMTAHLALNLLWLWLFLRDDRLSHALAALVGFAACGLHQIVFHPLFVAPFILSLLFARRWRLFSFYVAVYGAICFFWLEYWVIAQWLSGIAGGRANEAGASFLFERVTMLLANSNIGALFLMMGNLARFFAWQNPIALPLALLSAGAIRRGEGVARPLAAGFLLSIAAFGILLAQQGNGWGYRYLHGFLGSWSLLAAYGWIAITQNSPATERRAAGAAVAIATALALLVAAPRRLAQAVATERPYRAAIALAARARTDVVLVDRTHLMHGGGLVRNDPFLAQRPLTLDLVFIDDAALRDLCARRSVALLSEGRALALGIPYYSTARNWDELRDRKLALLKSLSCGREID